MYANRKSFTFLLSINYEKFESKATYVDENVTENSILIGPFVAVATIDNSMDAVWFVQISQNCVRNGQAVYMIRKIPVEL